MKISTLLLFIFLFSFSGIYGQTRIIYEKVIDEHLETIPAVWIQNSDSIILAKTDLQGKFKVEISLKETKLIVSGLGYEWTTIQLPQECGNLEIILLLSSTYDFMSFRKIDRQRRKQFKKLTFLHNEAYKKGLFLNMEPCYKQEFIPIRSRSNKFRKDKQN
ncbi:hypothetical protein GM921_07825 [Pedobacter sp. LMG 31464]|uniref:CarboxypepD_reg-like domain-containing protein n=1 Tax=Pedobacter planticolens TaxID=2679964 RepID=A0A923E0S9_9SPHI|nr:hypothetical protein [Pedobacter planticolens]MBB2145387.1 hypothetical protein [Pedobacter planticolens]